MSVVSLQLGQCGNQIGHELFSVISDDSNGPNRKKYKQCSDERFFYETSTGGRFSSLMFANTSVIFDIY